MIYFYYFQTLLNNMHTVVLSKFRKTRTKDRIESYRIESYRIESYRIVSNRIESYRIVSYRMGYSLKMPKKKTRIKLSNLYHIKIKIFE